MIGCNDDRRSAFKDRIIVNEIEYTAEKAINMHYRIEIFGAVPARIMPGIVRIVQVDEAVRIQMHRHIHDKAVYKVAGVGRVHISIYLVTSIVLPDQVRCSVHTIPAAFEEIELALARIERRAPSIIMHDVEYAGHIGAERIL